MDDICQSVNPLVSVANTGSWIEASTVVVQVTKYYTFSGQRIAVRVGGVVYYLHSDHLGSVSLATDYASRITAQQRYLPYGGVRWQEGTFPTDIGFTGQRHDGAGLVYMRARYYHPGLGRFARADPPSLQVHLRAWTSSA